jgi:hypothetical protein
MILRCSMRSAASAPARSASLIRVEKPTEQGTDLDYRALDDKDLATIIDKLPERPLLAGEEGIRA